MLELNRLYNMDCMKGMAEFPDGFFDLAIGNVPFGNYSLADRRYDKEHFLIHDYFFAKTIDKVRAGGVIAFVTSNGVGGGTMDKKDRRAREYIARRCDLLGAVRLGEEIDAHLQSGV